MIIQGITKGLNRARASVTLDNINLSQEFMGALPRSIEMVGGRFATYEALYRTQPWVYATVNRLARGLSRLPLPIFVDGGRPGERTRIREGSLFELVHNPWPAGAGSIQAGTTVLMVQHAMLSVLIHGMAVFVKGYSPLGERLRRNEPVYLFPSRAFNWMAIHENGGFVGWDRRTPRGTVRQFPEDVLIIAPWGVGADGLPNSPLEPLRTTLMSEDATQRAIIQQFEHGARPIGFIGFEGSIKPEHRRSLTEEVVEAYAGVDNFYKVHILDNGAKWQSMSASFVDTEMVNLRKLNREEIAAVFNVPQPSVGILDRATFSNVSEQHIMEYMDTYEPWAKLIQESFRAQVIDPEPAWSGRYIEFNFKAVLKGDPRLELETATKARGGPVLSLNEARATQNLPPLDDPEADRVLTPQNMDYAPGNGERSA